MLNLSPHNPAVLAKMVATADRVTKGRVIAAVGSGWFREELAAYNVSVIQDHDGRSAYAREVVELWRQLWLHPAPELTTFEGEIVQVHDLPFSPAPHQKPMPPIWMGGDSDDCLARLAEYESWGVTHVWVTFDTLDHQDRAARLILPRLGELAAAS